MTLLSHYREETEVTDAPDDALTAEARRLDEQDHDEDWAADDPDEL